MGKNWELDIYFGEKIRQARVAKKVSQEELGKILSLSKSSISLMEKGKRRILVTDLSKISEFLNTEIKFFFDFSEHDNFRKISSKNNAKFFNENNQEIITKQIKNEKGEPNLNNILSILKDSKFNSDVVIQNSEDNKKDERIDAFWAFGYFMYELLKSGENLETIRKKIFPRNSDDK